MNKSRAGLDGGKYYGLETACAAAIAAAVVVFGFVRLRYGLSFSDEGLALSTPMRFTMGDRPFRDEVLVSARWFEILMTLVVPNLPARGSVIALRELAFVFHAFCAGALLYSVKRFFRPLAIAGLFAVAVYSNIFNYWTPTYHTAAADFICLGLALLVAGIESETARLAAARGVLCGIAFSLAWACELPAAVALVAPAGAAIAGLTGRGAADDGTRARGRAEAICGVSAIVTSVALLGAAFGAIAAAGLAKDLRAAAETFYSIPGYSSGAVSKIQWIMRDSARALPWLAFHALCWGSAAAAARVARPGWKGHAANIAAACAALLYAAAPLMVLRAGGYQVMFAVLDYMEGFCLFAMAAVPAALIIRRSERDRQYRGACVVIFSVGAVWLLAMAYLAGTGLNVGVVFSFPFLAVSLALCAQGGAGAAPRWRASVAALILCVGMAAGASNLYCFNEHEWFWRLDGVYKTGKLEGIHHFEGYVQGTEGLLDYLLPRTKKGDYLLSFYGNPMLYYLTETRAAIETGLPAENWPAPARAGFIRRMVERGRVPCYAVHFGSVRREPIYDFVRRHYSPVARFDRFYVWKLRDGSRTCQ